MHEFVIEYLIEDAARITRRLGSPEALNQGLTVMTPQDGERLQRIHDELIALECDDSAALARIAEFLIPDMLH